MAHWRLTPEQLKELNEDQLSAMDLAYRLYERKNLENLNEIVGTLLGASWNSDHFPDGVNKRETSNFTWSLRKNKPRINTPLSVVFGGDKFLAEVKKEVSKVTLQKRADPSMLNVPAKGFAKEEIVDLSTAPVSEFLKIAGRVGS